MVIITSEDFEVALGGFLSKTTDVTIKNVIGTFDKDKTVPQNISKLKENSSGVALQDTIAFLKSNCTEYPVAQQVLSCKNQNKEEYSRDIAKFLDFVKPTQCLSCKENYIPAAEQCAGNEPKCYLCQRPSHGECYKNIVINPELGVIFVCPECMSVKAARELAEELQNHVEDSKSKSSDKTDTSAAKPSHVPADNNAEKTEETNNRLQQQDCPLYLKRICPHGLTGRREINGNPCPYKHRRLCMYYAQHGPSGCRFRNNCRYFHPDICQNSINLNMCLNRSCQDFHIKGTQRKVQARPLPDRDTNTPSQREDTLRPPRRNKNPILPWINSHQQTETNPENHQTRHDTNAKETISFLDKYFSEMKESLARGIIESIQNNRPQPQVVMMQPTNQNLHAPAPHLMYAQPENSQNQNVMIQQTANTQSPYQQEGGIQTQTPPSMLNQQHFPHLLQSMIPQ